MATQQLPITSATGEQATTQSPQSATPGSIGGQTPTSLQQNAASSLLTSQNGVTLYPTVLSSASLNNLTSSTVAQATPQKATSHRVDTPLLSISLVLLVAAIIMVWLANKSAETID